MTKQGIAVVALLGLVLIAGIGFTIWNWEDAEDTDVQAIMSFDDCVRAGNPVMESYPRQCNTPEGQHFVEKVEGTDSTTPPVVTGGCFVGGCSGEVCSDQEGIASNCIYKPEYACYKGATCARQADGKCGWTQNPTLSACLMTYFDTGGQ